MSPKIYTRTGDGGETSLLGGDRVPKSALRVAAYGDVDELNAVLGVARTEVTDRAIPAVLDEVQRGLFSIGAILADPKGRLQSEKVALDLADVKRLEEHIDHFETELSPLKRFLLPGGAKGAALLHQARSVCRRAERTIVTLASEEPIPPGVVAYVNRLSDLLFVMARSENRSRKVRENVW